MTGNSDLTAPGSSTYASDTLHVGDGTWDAGRDTFLLPNLMGVNFDTMRYNGRWILTLGSSLSYIVIRHGKPIQGYALLSYSNSRTWCYWDNRIPRPCSDIYIDYSILLPMESVCGIQIACLVPSPYFTAKHSSVRLWMVCSRAGKESNQPSPRNWTGDLCHGCLSNSVGLVPPQSRKQTAKIPSAVEISGKLRTLLPQHSPRELTSWPSDSPMDWPSPCHPRTYSDSLRTHPLWFAKVVVHTIFRRRFRPPGYVFRPVVPV